jgi:hypothetical protein
MRPTIESKRLPARVVKKTREVSLHSLTVLSQDWLAKEAREKGSKTKGAKQQLYSDLISEEEEVF